MNHTNHSKPNYRSAIWLTGTIVILIVGVAAYAGYSLNVKSTNKSPSLAAQATNNKATSVQKINDSDDIKLLLKSIQSLQSDIEDLQAGQHQPSDNVNTDVAAMLDDFRGELDTLRQENSEILQHLNGLSPEYEVQQSAEVDQEEANVEETVSDIEQQFDQEQNTVTQWGSETQQAITAVMTNNVEMGELVAAECRGSACKLESVHSDSLQVMEFAQEMMTAIDGEGEGMQTEIRQVEEGDGRVRLTAFFKLDQSRPAVSD